MINLTFDAGVHIGQVVNSSDGDPSSSGANFHDVWKIPQENQQTSSGLTRFVNWGWSINSNNNIYIIH